MIFYGQISDPDCYVTNNRFIHNYLLLIWTPYENSN
jgi:hypothetical protein